MVNLTPPPPSLRLVLYNISRAEIMSRLAMDRILLLSMGRGLVLCWGVCGGELNFCGRMENV